MLDHQKSSDAAAVVSVTQKYQEFVPELDRWVHIESNPGLMESARPRQSRAIVEVAPPMEQPLLPVNARERPKRRLVPINSVLFNHELPVVTALPSEDQQQPSAPRKRALKLASNASSGVSQVSLVDVNSSEVMGMGLSTEDLHYLIHKKVFGNPQRTSVGSLQISRDALSQLQQKLTEENQVIPITIEKLQRHKEDQVTSLFNRLSAEAAANNEEPETRDEIDQQCSDSIPYLNDIPGFLQEQWLQLQYLPLEQQPLRRVRVWRGVYVINDALIAWQKRLIDLLTVREEIDNFPVTDPLIQPQYPPPAYPAPPLGQAAHHNSPPLTHYPPPSSEPPTSFPAYWQQQQQQQQQPSAVLQTPPQFAYPPYPMAPRPQYDASAAVFPPGQFAPPPPGPRPALSLIHI